MSDTTSKDDELYEAVEYAVTAEYKSPNGEPAKSRIDRLMHLIKQYGIQERIDELKDIPGQRINSISYKVDPRYLRGRIEELTALKDKEIE